MSGQRALTVGFLVLCCISGRSLAQNRRLTEPKLHGISDIAREAQRQTQAAEAARKQYVWQAQCLARDPYRKVGNVFLDLRTMTGAVLANHPSNRPPEVRRWGFFTNSEVLQVVSDGMRIQVDEEGVFVANHPSQRIAYDHMILEPFAACEVGRYQYRSVAGANLTVRKFDYGIPFDPWQRKRDFEAARAAGATAQPKKRTGNGSGFFITHDGYFVTSEHVVADAERVEIKTAQGTFPAQVVVSSKESDLAILKAAGAFAAIAISTNSPKLGDPVFTIGYPSVDLTGMAPKYTEGKISSLAGLHDSPDRFQVSVPIQPGNSGGPLVDMAGDVVGVVVASLSDLVGLSVSGALPQNVNYAVTGSRLAALARVVPELRGKLKTPGSNPVQNPRDAAKRVEDASALVIAY